jgi:hypothetical protein
MAAMIRSRVPARRWGHVAALALTCATAIAAPSYADPLPPGTDVDCSSVVTAR